MNIHSELWEVSFVDLAEQHDMARTRPRSWRDQRDTLSARRRRRRTHRRDRPSSTDYHPIVVDSQEANRGIRSRLLGGMAAASVTVLCLLSIFLAPEFTLASTFALTVAVGSFGLSMALTMSARREEIFHQIAGQLTAEEERLRLPPPQDEDGSLTP